MAEVIRMPRMSDTMEEGVIVEWNKKVGDSIKAGDILAEVETDKATMELESYQEGTLLYIGVEKGDTIPVDAILAILGEKGEDYKSILEEEKKAESAKPKEDDADESDSEKEEESAEKAEPKKEKESETDTESSKDGDRVKISPLASKMAKENDIDVNQLKGSGDGGRIIKRDIEEYIEKGPQQTSVAPTVAGKEAFEEKNVSQMRKTIAKRLSESKFTAPHFYLTASIRMDKAVKARASMNEVSETKISFNDLIIKAAAMALRSHPQVNASWRDTTIRYNKHIHIGMAVAMDEGLLVPVIRFADMLSLNEISATAKDFGQKVKDRKLQPSDWEGNTFTISNLGMFDIEEFTAIINPPDACILAVGSIKEEAVVENGEIKAGHTLRVTLSCDHRVVDGVTGAKFLKTFKDLLEDPVRMLI
ncbi:MAG: pyruvate dehydrogenase complex dihydrolipoamide acetyltransferase [Chitinophagaceae bacterium]|nr:MAG: pyruvate dehydrogenase complex dihydrolipoamide acetyltransferase [Chitinophagaceae bacterium]